jgi:hypothetical protein
MHLVWALPGLSSLLAVTAALGAETPPDPLLLIPAQAHLAVKIERPRELAEGLLKSEAVRRFGEFEAVRELADSTRAHLVQQFIAYFEQQLGTGRFKLLDRLAGGGIALGVRFGSPPTALLVVRGTDEKTVTHFVRLGRELLAEELALQESKERLRQTKYRGVETFGLGNDFCAAQAGSDLLISNVQTELQRAIDLHLDGPRKSLAARGPLIEARTAMGAEPLAWAWLDLEQVHKLPGAADVFAARRNNAQLTVLFGGLLDVASRSPFLCAGLYPQERGFTLSVRMPRGRTGMPQALSAHVPSSSQVGSRPLLEPKNVVFSTSFYLDIAKFFTERTKLFNAEQVKGIDDFDKKSAAVLAGSPFSKLAGLAAPYHRFVVVHQDDSVYKTVPQVRLPAFALVTEMRDPEKFGKRLDIILRSTALFAGFFAPLRLAEERYGGTHIVGYRFSEERTVNERRNDLFFNFSPCFARVGDQFVASSTVELCRELIEVVKREAKQRVAASSPAVVRSQLYSTGAAALLEARKDQLFTRITLDQALPPGKAAQEVQSFVQWVRELGSLQTELSYGLKDFRYDLIFQFAPGKTVARFKR